MSASRLLKLLAALSLGATAAAVLQWHDSGHAPSPWLIRLSFAAFAAALAVALIGEETRPRLMLRFLAAVCALASAVIFVADLSRIGSGFTAIAEHLSQFAPSALAALQAQTVRLLGEGAWEPLMSSLLAVPTSFAFAGLALVLGFAARPRREVKIFVN